MKSFILLSIVLLSQSRMLYSGNWKGFSQSAKPSKLDIVSGLMAGLALDSGNLALSPCLQDLENISRDLAGVVLNIEKPSFTSLFSILRQIEAVLKGFPETFSECMAELKGKEARVKAGLSVLRSPKSTRFEEGVSLLINGVEVYDDVLRIQEKLLLSKWFDAGFAIGHVISKLAPKA